MTMSHAQFKIALAVLVADAVGNGLDHEIVLMELEARLKFEQMLKEARKRHPSIEAFQ